jgi:hypothetical protein
VEEERGVYTNMDWWTKIRLEVLREETSKREVLRREGIHWETLKKILEYSEPPGYRTKNPRPKPKIGPYLEQIAQIATDSTRYGQNLEMNPHLVPPYIYERVRLFLKRRHKVRSRGIRRFPLEKVFGEIGVLLPRPMNQAHYRVP